MYSVCTVHILVCTQYVLSTYSVQGYARCIPRLQRRSDVAVLRLCLLPSKDSVHTWKGTVLYWCVLFCIGLYYAIVSYHLVLLCSGTYLLVMQFTILRILTSQFGTWYIQICTAIRHFDLVLCTSKSAQR
jgi:hypothetical protein